MSCSWFLFFCWTWDFLWFSDQIPLLCLQSLTVSFQFDTIYGWGSPDLFHFGFLLRVSLLSSVFIICIVFFIPFTVFGLHSGICSYLLWVPCSYVLLLFYIFVFCIIWVVLVQEHQSLRKDCVFSDDLFMWLVLLQWDLDIWSYFVGSVSWHGNRVCTLLTWCLDLSFHWPQLVRLSSMGFRVQSWSNLVLMLKWGNRSRWGEVSKPSRNLEEVLRTCGEERPSLEFSHHPGTGCQTRP